MELTSHAPRANTADTSWFAGLLGAASTRMRQRRVYRDTFTELNALSDRDLTDLGLSRSMIRSVARDAASRA